MRSPRCHSSSRRMQAAHGGLASLAMTCAPGRMVLGARRNTTQGSLRGGREVVKRWYVEQPRSCVVTECGCTCTEVYTVTMPDQLKATPKTYYPNQSQSSSLDLRWRTSKDV